MANIGFIGLGNMGGPMARNLIRAGHKLKVYDLKPEAVQYLAQAGAKACQSIKEAASGVEFVVSMVPTGKETREVYYGAEGALAAADKGTILLDCSTIDVETARVVAKAAAEAGFDMLDAPVSGGQMGAEAGTLTFMCGGNAATFAKARPILEGMGKTIVHAGGPGNGQAAKICNNMMAAINMIGTCEAFVLAEKLGLDKQVLFDVVSKSSGSSFALTNYCPVPGPVPTTPANRGYQPGFAAKLMWKDLRLAQDAARQTGVATPLGAQVQALLALYVNAGNGDMDFSGIIHMIRGKA